MTPVISFPGIAKFASLIGDAVKHVASKVNFASAFRQVGQVGGQAPGALRLMRLDSHEEGRAAFTMKSGVDPSLEQRRNSLDSRERVVTERRSSRQGYVSSNSIPHDHAEMVVQKATVLAKDYLASRETAGTNSLPTSVAGLCAAELQKSWLHDHFSQHRDVSPEVLPAEPVSANLVMGSHPGKWATFVKALRRIFVSSPDTPIEKLRLPGNGALRVGSGSNWCAASARSTSLSSSGSVSVLDDVENAAALELAPQAWQPGVASSQGKDVQRHTVKALRDLQNELASTGQLFDGSPRGEAARRVGAAVARVRKECGPDKALRIASQGIQAVRSAPAKLLEPSRTHRLI
ncbi:hypothetical protein [Pinirhizobacter soli]|uniref:hypothetical protein n=1 Tax=Pinirhizobacter soli TaxID=2786953 RepID=UPI00202A3F86|nr:hypothetical protein [Pinirhizobacter soli]